MEAVIIPEIQNELNALAQRYAGQFQRKVKEVLGNNKFKGSGELQQSVKVRVVPATPQTAPRIEVDYAEHGELIGKRKLIYTKFANVDAMLRFVQSGKFRMKSVPGYAPGVVPAISEETKQRRIAFAIAKSRFGEHRNKAKRWKKESLPELLREMNRELTTAWANKTAQILAQSLSTKPL